AIAIANPYAIANDEFINWATELEKIKIFHSVDFPVLIAQLRKSKSTIPNDKQPQEVRRAFVEQLLQTWLNAFNLTPEMVNLSKEELQALDNYFYANYFIIQCKQAAVRVSPKTWEAIEEGMLLVPNN
nr:histidine kinase [Brasilonema bromeliae SPC951]